MTLGLASCIIFVTVIAVLIIHRRLITRRGRVEDTLAILDDMLRDRLEELCVSTKTEANFLDALQVADIDHIINKWPKVQKISPDASTEEILAVVGEYNTHVRAYNAYIATPRGRTIAFMVGLDQCEEICLGELPVNKDDTVADDIL